MEEVLTQEFLKFFFTKISEYLSHKFDNKVHLNKSFKKIVFSLINVIIIICIVYGFTEYIYYEYLYTDDVSNEINVEKVIDELRRHELFLLPSRISNISLSNS